MSKACLFGLQFVFVVLVLGILYKLWGHLPPRSGHDASIPSTGGCSTAARSSCLCRAPCEKRCRLMASSPKQGLDIDIANSHAGDTTSIYPRKAELIREPPTRPVPTKKQRVIIQALQFRLKRLGLKPRSTAPRHPLALLLVLVLLPVHKAS